MSIKDESGLNPHFGYKGYTKLLKKRTYIPRLQLTFSSKVIAGELGQICVRSSKKNEVGESTTICLSVRNAGL